jgi:hypothetical protein
MRNLQGVCLLCGEVLGQHRASSLVVPRLGPVHVFDLRQIRLTFKIAPWPDGIRISMDVPGRDLMVKFNTVDQSRKSEDDNPAQ